MPVRTTVFAMLLCPIIVPGAAAVENDHEEQGTFRWMGDYEAVLTWAAREDKPVVYLSKTHYRFLPMTEIQKVHVNIALHDGKEPGAVLSPRQRKALRFIRIHPDYPWENLIDSGDFRGDWKRIWKTIES